MRARYSAHVVGDSHFLQSSWHPDTRPPGVDLDPSTEWLGLTVLETTGGGPLDDTGTVTFIARFRHNERDGALAERSSFTRHEGRWIYLAGEPIDETGISRSR